ncbi:MAG: hypothetical protein A2Y10_07800 [Planctomycetes bacterium GWF2_41_51]|nr:MAG: hypothetical protein A2Y10_07800 [Planctomycetes bacterium GWF2_41_51]HBG26832.1 hypothetical protein [Phycisphaerales bacterium]
MAKAILKTGKIIVKFIIPLFILSFICYSAYLLTIAKAHTSQFKENLAKEPVWKEQISQRDKNSRVWEITKWQEEIDPFTDELNVVEVKSIVREKGCGICYKDCNDSWQITDTSWKETENGFVMDKANYSLEIGKTANSYLYYNIDGEALKLRADSIKISDGQIVKPFASIESNVNGHIDSENNNKLIYPNAFGKGIDLEIEALADGFHQNVIFKNKPVLPKGFDFKNAEITLYTEINSDCKESINATVKSKDDIKFIKSKNGKSFISHKFASSKILETTKGGKKTPFTEADKQITKVSGRNYLVESLKYSELENAGLPIIWDYRNVSGTLTEDQEWYADATYHVVSTLTLDTGVTLNIEPGTIVKFQRDTINGNYIDAWNGTLIAKGEPYSYIVFTSDRDPNMGEIIDTNPVAIGDWEGIYVNTSSHIEFCKVGYSNSGICAYASAPGDITIKNNIVYNSGYYGIMASSGEYAEGNLTVSNNLIDNVLYYNGIYVDYFYPIVISDVNILITNNTIKGSQSFLNDGSGIFVYNEGNHTAVIKNNIIQNAAYGIYSYGPSTENNNAFYQCTQLLESGTASPTDVNLITSPFDSNTYLGSYFLNNDPCGGALLVNGGNGNVSNYYEEPNNWSIYTVSGSDHLINSYASASSDIVWQPNFNTCDSGIVSMGYHHPRVDYLLLPNSRIYIIGHTITIMPGVVTAISSEAQISGTRVISNGLASDRIKYVSSGVAKAGWANIKYRAIGNGSVNISNVESEISFCDFIALGYGIQGGAINNPSHDNIFKLNYRGLQSNKAQNSIFIGNTIGMYHAFGADFEAINCNFDRNSLYGVYILSNSDVNYTAKNCIFTNTGTAGIFEYAWTKPSSLIEQYNGFYQNTRHKTFKRGSQYTYNALSSNDFSGQPYIAGTTQINSSDFYDEWEDFEDRFYLPQDSNLVDGGDPINGSMWGYTTDPTTITDPENAEIDTNRRDIGYHYAVSDKDINWNWIPDYCEFWIEESGGPPFDPECQGIKTSDFSEYTENLDGQNPGWLYGMPPTCGYYLNFTATINFDDSEDHNCGGINNNPQYGSIDFNIDLPRTYLMSMEVVGTTEREDGSNLDVDVGKIYLDEELKIYISGTDENKNDCSDTLGHNANQCPGRSICQDEGHVPNDSFYIEPGLHSIKIEAYTGDGMYNHNVHFYFRIYIHNPE